MSFSLQITYPSPPTTSGIPLFWTSTLRCGHLETHSTHTGGDKTEKDTKATPGCLGSASVEPHTPFRAIHHLTSLIRRAMQRCSGATQEMLCTVAAAVMRWRQVCAAPNYKRGGSGRAQHPGIPPSVVVGAGADTRIPRLSSLSQYFIESMAVAAQMSRSGATMGSTCLTWSKKRLRRVERRQRNNGVRRPRKKDSSRLIVSLVALSFFPFFPYFFFSCGPSFATSLQAVIPSTSG